MSAHVAHSVFHKWTNRVFLPMDEIDVAQSAISNWLKDILRQKQWTKNRLATETGVSKQVIGRSIDPSTDYRSVMSTINIQRIYRRTQVAPPNELLPSRVEEPGATEPEVLHLEAEGSQFAGMVLTPDQSVWEIKGRQLELAGVLPGDEVLLDRSVEPEDGNIVFAQVIDINTRTAETVIRRYERGSRQSPAFLHTETTNPECREKTLLVDGQRVNVIGTVEVFLRRRRSA